MNLLVHALILHTCSPKFSARIECTAGGEVLLADTLPCGVEGVRPGKSSQTVKYKGTFGQKLD